MIWIHCTRSLRLVALALSLLGGVAHSAAATTELATAHALDQLPAATAEPRIHALLLEWLEQQPTDGARAWVRAKLDWQPVRWRPLEDGGGRVSVPQYPIASTAAAVLRRWDLATQSKARAADPLPDLTSMPAAAVAVWLREAPADRIEALASRVLADPASQPESLLIELARRSPEPHALTAVAAHGRSAAALRLLRATEPDDGVLDTALANPALRAGTWSLIADRHAGERPDWRARLLDAAVADPAAAAALRRLPDHDAILRGWLSSADGDRQRAALVAAGGLPAGPRKALIRVLRDNPDADAQLLAEVATW